jgi:hypothetical protein
MPYIGKSPLTGNYNKLDSITGSFNGSTTAFNLTVGSNALTPVRAETLLVSLNGVIQQAATDYTVSGTQITFTTAPASSDACFIIAFGEKLDIGTPSDATVTSAKLSGDLTLPGKLTAAGDTAAGDNAAIGYTAAEGLILTGQGSTSDITIKNDADANVMTVATGTTVAAFASAPTGIITDQFHVTGGVQANVTGDGTAYTVVFGSTEIYDAGGVFTTSTYTASAAGKAHLHFTIEMGPYASDHARMLTKVITSNRDYTADDVNPYTWTNGASTYNRWNGSFICDMDASDTATIYFYCTGGDKVLDISASNDCHFTGYLIKD